jgi:hypothetical protein
MAACPLPPGADMTPAPTTLRTPMKNPLAVMVAPTTACAPVAVTASSTHAKTVAFVDPWELRNGMWFDRGTVTLLRFYIAAHHPVGRGEPICVGRAHSDRLIE